MAKEHGLDQIMEIPEAFKRVCDKFGPDLEEIVSSLDDLVQLSLIGIDEADAKEIKPYLDVLLSGRYDHDQLKDIFWSMPGTTKFRNGRDVVTFLTRMREVLDGPGPPYVIKK